MYRTHTCGELRLSDAGKKVILCGWVQRSRDFGGMTFLDLRDRYGITQLVFDMEADAGLCEKARKLGREYVIRVNGEVRERINKNPKISTGDIEIEVDGFEILNPSDLPPFTIENETDGGEELRMKYRYIDLRRPCLQENLILRNRMAREVRRYLDSVGFIEIETPALIKSTPEGARDFVVPSRLQPGLFYALPQSPQTFKQLLMIAGFDRYYQIVRCFRDEDLRADRQPEFTQIDCEMSFVEQNDVLETFEGLAKHLFRELKKIEFHKSFPRLSWADALKYYGTDKPDIRFGMKISEVTDILKGKGFGMFDNAEFIGCICAEGASEYSRKQTDELNEFVRKPQIGASGIVTIKYAADGMVKSSIDKYFTSEELQSVINVTDAKPGSLVLIIAGERSKSLTALSELRLEMGRRLGLINAGVFSPLWVVDFPLFEWNDEEKRFTAMHHPFTSPKTEDIEFMISDPGRVRANSYDLVINGIEIGGGSIRIHDSSLQELMFKALGFTEEEADKQFGFLINAFRYGAPPHGGIAFGFDRWVALFAGEDSIREVIAFPKNNAGRDIMIDAPAEISRKQLDELMIEIKKRNK
ncbi:MAG TPA: aspartate--tRNA ligase [Bacteroidales bacterium]|nr:aspartate--tRNA ligase [Bacteroidales bacterium]HCI56186.1 aspartate--tRNA ligase [Bacteroidales bacterium]HOU96928.1 aspartate--tRNA ligase [Bacteroidales bacterium]HQG36773.1 aspartate--tRNA ligase [Bacteroidales bacterium]HQG53781.1 aspartate--tRNA ligase [Bacteroidales bacterium]